MSPSGHSARWAHRHVTTMAGFIRRIVNKTKEVFERLIAKARSIIESIDAWIKRVNRHREYIEDVEVSTPTYEPEMVDVRLAEDLKRELEKMVPEGLVAHMQKMTPEERSSFIENILLPFIASKMSINIDRLEWIENDGRLCGYYNHTDNVIALNMAFLASDSEKLLTVLMNTIFHECKHARQWAAVEGADLGYSQHQINEWKRNFDDYISPRESDEGYYKQPVEEDARGFANSIIDENIIFGN